MITVGVTILVWFPLALEGGPLWKPHYDLAPGPVYSIFVLDPKWIKWKTTQDLEDSAQA
jgi:hypothetical protein